MNDFMNKLSSYNLFNNLLPGILFIGLLHNFTELRVPNENLLLSIFLYYFIGLTISRISSITIEPLLKFIKFVKFREYKYFVKASSLDTKLDIMIETNNKFRVLLTMVLLVILSKMYLEFNQSYFKLSISTQQYILLFLLFIIYLFAYRKQTNYIVKRIDVNN